MTKTENAEKLRRNPFAHKPMWTKDKITQLIALYRKNECLWNHYTNDYKNKGRRRLAIEKICAELNISYFEYGKKIHNLRNQFNTEMKKLERRMEEINANGVIDTQRCRWDHFESLMFLREVIEPRPGGYKATSAPRSKRMRLKCAAAIANANVNVAYQDAEPDMTEYHLEEDEELEEADIANDDLVVEEEEEEFANNTINYEYSNSYDLTAEPEDFIEQKYEPPIKRANNNKIMQKCDAKIAAPAAAVITPTTTTHRTTYAKKHSTPQHDATILHLNTTTSTHCPLPMGAVIELPSPSHATAVNVDAADEAMPQSMQFAAPKKFQHAELDEWDNFGILIASELRNLNSTQSRKKLKRKIMSAILEVGEEDDVNSGGASAK